MPTKSRTEQGPLLFTEELAVALRRSRQYVWRMKRLGFAMPGGSATLAEAREFLEKHPYPMSKFNAAKRSETLSR